MNRPLTAAVSALAALLAVIAVDRTVIRRRYGAGLLAKAGGATTVLSVRAGG